MMPLDLSGVIMNKHVRLNSAGATVWVWVLLLLAVACNTTQHNDNEVIIARFDTKFLYASSLAGLFPAGSTPQDSMVIAKRFIDNWIKQEVFLAEALENLDQGALNIEKQLQDYKHSLLLFAYENQLVKSHLDTLVTEEQIQAYYEQNRDIFKLKEDIVKVQYIKVPRDAPEVWRLRRLYRSTDPDDYGLLEEYCIQHAANYFIDGDTWLFFRDLLREIPIGNTPPEVFLRNNRYLELTDAYYRYFLSIIDYKLKGSESPLVFERDHIKMILLSLRRHTFIQEKRDAFFQQALTSGRFEVYAH